MKKHRENNNEDRLKQDFSARLGQPYKDLFLALTDYTGVTQTETLRRWIVEEAEQVAERLPKNPLPSVAVKIQALESALKTVQES